MDTGFFRSKQFAVSGVIAVLIVAGGAIAVSQTSFGHSYRSTGCEARTLTGTALDVVPTVADAAGALVTTYTLDASAFDRGTLKLCTRAGDITVEATASDTLTLEVRVSGGAAEDRAGVPYYANFTSDGGALGLAAWEGGRDYSWRFNGVVPHANVVLRVPEALLVDADVATAYGDVRVLGLRTSSLDVGTSSGEVVALALLSEGHVDASSRYGDVELDFASVQSGNVTADARSGDVDIRLPPRADVGYDVYAETRTGDVSVRVGAADVYDSESRGIGQTVHVRTRDFDSAPTQVTVRADTRYGDVSVLAEEASA